MKIKECWVSIWIVLLIDFVATLAHFIFDRFDTFTAFGLKPSELIDLVAITAYISYLLFVMSYIMVNRKAQNNKKQ